jgi:hypothetical protein
VSRIDARGEKGAYMEPDDCAPIVTDNLNNLSQSSFDALLRIFKIVRSAATSKGTTPGWESLQESGSYSFKRDSVVIGKLFAWKGEVFVGFREDRRNAQVAADALASPIGDDVRCRRVNGESFSFVAVPMEGHEVIVAEALIAFLRDPG